jgi:hypothetical protein
MDMSNTKTKPSLKEVTANNTGVAWLLSVNTKTDQTMFEKFEEDDNHKDPIAWAWALHESIKDDWPDSLWTVVANDRAKFLGWQKRMGALLGEGNASPEEYVAL